MGERSKVVTFYEKLSKAYDKKRLSSEKSKIISKFQIDWFIGNLVHSNSTVCLEIGCGTGRLTKELIKEATLLVATDTSRQMIRINKTKLFPLLQKNKICYVICDASHLPFRNKTFSNVTSARVFWHIQTYSQVITESFRVLSENGLLLFDFPCLWSVPYLYSKFRRIKIDVLTLFIDEKTIKQLFKKTNNLSIRGNASLVLCFVPSKLLKMKTVKTLIHSLEIANNTFFKKFLYKYYLIKVKK